MGPATAVVRWTCRVTPHRNSSRQSWHGRCSRRLSPFTTPSSCSFLASLHALAHVIDLRFTRHHSLRCDRVAITAVTPHFPSSRYGHAAVIPVVPQLYSFRAATHHSRCGCTTLQSRSLRCRSATVLAVTLPYRSLSGGRATIVAVTSHPSRCESSTSFCPRAGFPTPADLQS